MNDPLRKRIESLEARLPSQPRLSPSVRWAETVRLRAVGASEPEIGAALERLDPSAAERSIGEYDHLDAVGLWIPPRSWLTDSPHPFVRCVARWQCGVVSVVTHPDEPPLSLEPEPGVILADLDPLWLAYFARLIAAPEVWRSFWALPAETRTALTLPGCYSFLASENVERFDADVPPEEAAAMRADLARFRDWITARQAVDGDESMPVDPPPMATIPWPSAEPFPVLSGHVPQ
jgi:hypothetical protein